MENKEKLREEFRLKLDFGDITKEQYRELCADLSPEIDPEVSAQICKTFSQTMDMELAKLDPDYQQQKELWNHFDAQFARGEILDNDYREVRTNFKLQQVLRFQSEVAMKRYEEPIRRPMKCRKEEEFFFFCRCHKAL